MWLVLIERSFQGLFVVIETVKIVEESIEIWPNEVYDTSFSLSDKNLYQHLQSLNLTFRSSQINSNSAAVIADRGIKKSHVTTVVAHVWSNNSVVKQL